VRAEIKGIISPDVGDLSVYSPNDPDVFGFLAQLLIGPKHAESQESFEVMVCTPKWLSENFPKDRIVLGCHHLIVFEYNYRALMKYLNRYVETLDGETWHELAQKLTRLGAWEFENYQNDESSNE
jgi:hypothetical protein